MNSSGAGRSQRRKSSRTNSTSSSVVTVKKAASVSSRSGSRTPHSATRPRSPDELGPQLTALLQSSFDPSVKGRRSSSWSRPGSSTGIREGVGNLNRWSQSTTSSASGQDSSLGRKRKSSSSKHMSIGPLPMLGSDMFERPQNAQANEVRPSSRRSPAEKLQRQDASVPPALDSNIRLPPIGDFRAPSSVSNPLETPSTGSATPLTAELLTPSTAPSDYFGEQWTSRQRATSQGLRSAPRPAPRSAKTSESPKVQRHFQKSPQTPIDLATKPMPALPSEASDSEPKHSAWRAGHARSQGQDGTGSGDTDGGSSTSSTGSERRPPQQRRSPAQKTMLSQALSRANSAVLLDNAQDFRGAIEAYGDACQLLRQVMLRSSGDEDRNKLQAIRSTYTNRVVELVELEQAFTRSRNPPTHDDYSSGHDAFHSNGVDYEDELDYKNMAEQQQSLKPAEIPPRRQSLLPFSADTMIENIQSAPHQPSIIASYYPSQSEMKTSFLTVKDSMRPEYMPPPLSPRRPLSPSSESQARHGQSYGPTHVVSQLAHHNRDSSQESTSWLNTVEESGGSSASSLHSRTSSVQYSTSNVPDSADRTEVDFDLALDAAVDAAYDEPHGDYTGQDQSNGNDIMSMARRNIALAKEMVREVERETARSEDHRLAYTASSPETVRQQSHNVNDEADYLDEEAEEEERLLEEMTRGYIMDDFEFNIQSKSALPRKSDSSSNFSGRTYGSSTGSTTITTGTSLSTLAESLPTPAKQTMHPPHLPPAGSLPTLPTPGVPSSQVPVMMPTPSNSRPLSFDKPVPGPGVRDRRLSGQNARLLKIETNPRRFSGASVTKPQPPRIPLSHVQALSPDHESESSNATLQNKPDPPKSAIITPGARPQTPLTSLQAPGSSQNQSPATPGSTLTESQASEENEAAVPPSPARFQSKPMPPPPTTIRKNFSSSSLRVRNLSVTNVDPSDASPITPSSASFPLTKESSREALPQVPTLPTPTTGAFALHGHGEGSWYLFDDPILVPQTPGTPGSTRPNAPVVLEACPESFLLRPFWLMRCLYQTVAHPRGGYLSTKLFVPRDIWRVKNVKLKAIDDKISQCDLLTAALLKLAKVDTLDADAVLEEMQSFESVMEQVRGALQKKLGNEVGVSGSAGLFKSSSATEESQADPLAAKSSNVPGKSYLASWRKLRSKSSGAGINASYAPLSSKDAAKDSLTMATLPMTAQPSSRFAKRHVHQTQGVGPNASYMGALARLFDAVQVLDQIARQVEDPGLKCSSKTHVGLELCTRNAAEFFGFYICRFALGDIGLMLDKFIKRGVEWVLV